MSALKITLLLVTWASHHIAWSSPTPPASAMDRSPYQSQGLGLVATFLQTHTSVYVQMQKALVSVIILLELAYAGDILNTHHVLPESIELAQCNSTSPLFTVGVICALFGALVRLWTYRTLGTHFTFQLSIQKNHELITTGPYAYVRHPSYTASVITIVGVLLCELSEDSWWTEARMFDTAFGKCIAVLAGVCVMFFAQVVLRAWKEDEILCQEFGDQWHEWQRKVPCRFVPGIL